MAFYQPWGNWNFASHKINMIRVREFKHLVPIIYRYSPIRVQLAPIIFLKYFDILILRLKMTILTLKNLFLRLKRSILKFLISTLMFESFYYKVKMRI